MTSTMAAIVLLVAILGRRLDFYMEDSLHKGLLVFDFEQLDGKRKNSLHVSTALVCSVPDTFATTAFLSSMAEPVLRQKMS